MSVRWRFILYVILIHVALFVLALWILQHSKPVFVLVEVLLVVSLIWSVHIYRTFLKPLNMIAAGVETIRDKDFQSKFLPTGQAELDELIDIYNRMIEQLRDERTRQREQHYFLERLVHASPTGVLIFDLDEKVNLINPAAARLLCTSADELLGRSRTELPGPCGPALGALAPGEARVISVSGMETYRVRMSHFLDRGFHRHFILIEELTEEIVNTQKQAYTSIIRMMSHEVNNTVGAVNSILQSCLDFGGQLKAEDRSEFESAFDVAIRRNNGLNSFMSKLASVVRVPDPVTEECDLHTILNSVQVLAAHECEERRIEWIWRRDERTMLVQVDVNQMEQAILNIVRNAIEAVERDGSIIVETSSDNRTLTVHDSGPGIPDDVKRHLFAPFFSTKRNGQGVGLTLVGEILMNHGCTFRLENHANGGAAFVIRFPE